MARPETRAWMHKGRIYHRGDANIPDALMARMNPEREEASVVTPPDPLESIMIDGISDEVMQAIADAGFRTADAIRAATDEALLAVPGVGKSTHAKLRQAVS